MTGRDAWNGLGAYAEEGPDLAGPVLAGTLLLPRKAGFLCVFMSLVTFFRPIG